MTRIYNKEAIQKITEGALLGIYAETNRKDCNYTVEQTEAGIYIYPDRTGKGNRPEFIHIKDRPGITFEVSYAYDPDQIKAHMVGYLFEQLEIAFTPYDNVEVTLHEAG